ncbi:unnamed protein product [Arctogadus glacialis]
MMEMFRVVILMVLSAVPSPASASPVVADQYSRGMQDLGMMEMFRVVILMVLSAVPSPASASPVVADQYSRGMVSGPNHPRSESPT